MKSSPDTVRQEMERRSTSELTSILRNRDEEAWQSEVFAVVADVLRGRGISPEEIEALGPEGRDVLESEPTVTVETFFAPAEAHVARSALEDAGIPAWVTEDVMGSMYGVGVGARVQVRAQDAGRAAEFLAANPIGAALLPPELAEPPCPACGSQNVVSEAWVDQGEENDAPSTPNRRKWYYVCSDCQEAWPVE